MGKKQLAIAALLMIGMASVPFTQAWGQKQGRIEKLLKCLMENDLEKWGKNREKLDEKTLAAFGTELGTVDAIHDLWYKSDENAIASYYKNYEASSKAALPDICKEEKVDLAALRDKTDKKIVEIIKASANKLTISKVAIDELRNTSYPIAEELLKEILTVRESSLADDIIRTPALPKFSVYYAEFPKGKNEQQIRVIHNNTLYNIAKKSPTDKNFKDYFTEASLNTFFGGKEKRDHMTEVCSLYDDFLYQKIKECTEASSMRSCIDEYQKTEFLQAKDKKHTDEVEYLNDKTDYELLTPHITDVNSLGLIKGYLQQHKYKEFRDKANAFRAPFEAQIIWSNPISMKLYNNGKLQKSNEMSKDRNISANYIYNDKGALESIEENITEGTKVEAIKTFLFYDPQGRCTLEVRMDSKNKKEIQKRSRLYSQDGVTLSDSTLYADGRLILRKYSPQKTVENEIELGVQKDTLSYTYYKYDDKGRIVKTSRTFAKLPQPLPSQIVSQTDLYEYDKYGYLTKLTFEKVMVNNEKTTGSLIYLYDEYGNEIDSSSYYEYDYTGRWVRKTNKNNPEETERIQCTYAK